MSPYRPTLRSSFVLPLMALVTNTRLPQTIGLECPRPGIGVFQRTLVDFSTSQVVGPEKPSATPFASFPRKEGQLVSFEAPVCAAAGNIDTSRHTADTGANRIRFFMSTFFHLSGMGSRSRFDGSHCLPSNVEC